MTVCLSHTAVDERKRLEMFYQLMLCRCIPVLVIVYSKRTIMWQYKFTALLKKNTDTLLSYNRMYYSQMFYIRMVLLFLCSILFLSGFCWQLLRACLFLSILSKFVHNSQVFKLTNHDSNIHWSKSNIYLHDTDM